MKLMFASMLVGIGYGMIGTNYAWIGGILTVWGVITIAQEVVPEAVANELKKIYNEY